MLLAVVGIALTVLLLARDERSPLDRHNGPETKAEVRAILGPPDRVEVLRRAECWYYGPRDEFTEAKLCFGERGRLAWFAWGNREPPTGNSPPPPLFH